jgi:hypothetical protein
MVYLLHHEPIGFVIESCTLKGIRNNMPSFHTTRYEELFPSYTLIEGSVITHPQITERHVSRLEALTTQYAPVGQGTSCLVASIWKISGQTFVRLLLKSMIASGPVAITQLVMNGLSALEAEIGP